MNHWRRLVIWDFPWPPSLLPTFTLGLPPCLSLRSTAPGRLSFPQDGITLSQPGGSSWCGFREPGARWACGRCVGMLQCPGIHDCPSCFLEPSMASVISICRCQLAYTEDVSAWQQLRHWLVPGLLRLPWDQSYEPQEWRIEPQGIPGSLTRGKASRPGSAPEQKWGHLEPVKVRPTAKEFQWVIACVLRCVQLFWDAMDCSRQAPLCMGFSRQESWSALSCPPPVDAANPGIKPESPALQVDALPLSHHNIRSRASIKKPINREMKGN